uniref:Uncharacterized protein n=1 Tax=Anguilla anguilla TaxID=7936 RepID=A0A0E9PI93_ANGAN
MLTQIPQLVVHSIPVNNCTYPLISHTRSCAAMFGAIAC